MKINLLDHCLICLNKIQDDNSFITPNGPITRMTFANEVLPQLLLEKSAEKENSIRDLFNQLHFCSSKGDGGERDLCQQDQVKGQGDEISPPPLCSSCLQQQSTLIQLVEQLEVKTKEIRGKILGGDAGAIRSLLRRSEVVEEETKQRTLLLLDCLRQECCEGATTTEIINVDDDEGSSCGEHEEEEEEGEEDGIEKEDDDVVEVPLPPPKEVPVVDISDDDDKEVDEDAGMEDDDYEKQRMDLGEAESVEVPESGPSLKQLYPCPKANCDKSYNQLGHLTRHLEVAHRSSNGQSKPKPYTCKHCGNGFISSYNLKYHVESKHLRTNFICEICGKGFAGNSNLKLHYQRHLGIRDFQCPNMGRGCDKAYVDKRTLNSHLKNCKFGFGELVVNKW